MVSNIKILLSIFFLVFFFKTSSQINFTQNNTITVIENKSTLLNAWAGGLNFCQFSEIDLNLDGIKDILIFDRSGKNCSENGNRIIPMVFDPNSDKYVFSPDYIDNFPTELENWVLLLDYNQDGQEDIFTSINNSIALFTNISSTELTFEFTKILTTDAGFGPTNLYVSGVDLPAIIDIDNDCDIDVLSFNPQGTHVYFHQNKSFELYGVCDAIDLYRTDDCWGKFEENFTDNNLTLFLNEDCENIEDEPLRIHAGSTLLAIDLNPSINQGMELLIGDISYGNVVMVLNGGSEEEAFMISQDQNFPSYNESVNLPLFPGIFQIDVDKDELKDLIISPNGVNISENHKNCLFYKNIGTDQNGMIQFDFIQNNLFTEEMIDVGTGAIPILYDLNNDELVDLIIGNKGYYNEANYDARVKVYKNIGSLDEPIFELTSNDLASLSQIGNLISTENIHPTFGDLDNDLDQDLIVGDSNGNLFFIENISSENEWPTYTNELINLQIDVGSYATPQLIDLNRDGLLDLVVGERSGIDNGIYNGINYFENIGTVTEFQFSNQTPEFIDLDGTIIKSLGGINLMNPTFLTAYTTPNIFEHNGEYHMSVGTESGNIHFFNNIENDIYGLYNSFTENILNDFNCIRSSPTIHDLNNDGIPDLIRGNASGGVELFIGESFNLNTEQNEITSKNNYISPNPNSGEFKVYIPNNEKVNIQIFSLEGNLQLEQENVTNNQTINILNKTAGIYLINIISQEKVDCHKMIIY